MLNCARRRTRRRHLAGNPEVEDHGSPVARHEHVGGLEVSVELPSGVDRCDACRDLGKHRSQALDAVRALAQVLEERDPVY